MELLERAQALEALGSALESARRGNGRIAVVAGEAGVGKTALLRRFIEVHGRGVRWLWGACDPLSTPISLGPLHDMASSLGPELEQLLAHRQPRSALVFNEVVSELSRPGPQMMIFEDAHWADQATIDLLIFLSRRIDSTGSLVVVSHRDGLTSDHPLRNALGVFPSESLERIELAPLTEAAVAEFALRAGRSAENLHALTGGNPFFITELLASEDADVPASVTDAVLARVNALSDEAKAVVELISVVPGPTELWLLEEAEWPTTEALAECISSRLLSAEGEVLAYRHELARQAVVGSLPAPRRSELNRRVLEVLTKSKDLVDPARLAHHAEQAHDPEAVLRWAPEAGRRAAALGAHREGARHYEAALVYAERLPRRERAELLADFSEEAYLTGRPEDALRARQTALAIWKEEGEAEQVGNSLRCISRLHWWSGRRTEAQTAAAQAIAALRDAPAGRALAMAYSNQAQLEMLAHRAKRAIEWGKLAMDLARDLGDSETLAHALVNVGSARLSQGNLSGRSQLQEAFALAAAAGFDDHAARALVNLAYLTMDQCGYVRATADIERALRFVEERQLAGYAQYLTAVRSWLRLERGDWAGAEADAREVLDRPDEPRTNIVPALVTWGRLQARRGDGGAVATLEDAHARAQPTGELQRMGPVAAARAEHAWLTNDRDRVAREARPALPLAIEAEHPWLTGELAHWLQRAGAPVEVPDDVADPYRCLLAGDWQQAAALWDSLGCPYQRAEALAQGTDPAQLLDALEEFDRLGARRRAALLRRRMRTMGIRRIPRGPRPRTRRNPAGLTPRQVEVLDLLGEGFTNPEIAHRLMVSPKTVEHHVSAVLGKLGVSSRRDAVAKARQTGMLEPRGT